MVNFHDNSVTMQGGQDLHGTKETEAPELKGPRSYSQGTGDQDLSSIVTRALPPCRPLVSFGKIYHLPSYSGEVIALGQWD